MNALFFDSFSNSVTAFLITVNVSIIDFTPVEGTTGLSFDTANAATTTDNCKQDETVTFSNQEATVGPLTFLAGGTNVDDDTTIGSIGICLNPSADGDDFNDCGTGNMFAAVNTAQVTLGTGETVQITYQFAIDSDGT